MAGKNLLLWPQLGFTTADLAAYYRRVAPYLLPAITDRPLSYRMFRRGLDSTERFRQRIRWKAPPGVRVETFKADGHVFETRAIGGSLTTLLYLVEIGCISVDPWLSRIQTPDRPDFAVIDVDPTPGTPFQKVLDAARWLHELFERMAIPHVAKTSGISGLHVMIPLAGGATYPQARALCQTFANAVAQAHPRSATVERTIEARGRRVYLDCDQNMRAKTVAAPYSVRHSAFAGVSTPVTWDEIEQGIRPEDFTVRTIFDRLTAVGDIWKTVRRARGLNIAALSRNA